MKINSDIYNKSPQGRVSKKGFKEIIVKLCQIWWNLNADPKTLQAELKQRKTHREPYNENWEKAVINRISLKIPRKKYALCIGE